MNTKKQQLIYRSTTIRFQGKGNIVVCLLFCLQSALNQQFIHVCFLFCFYSIVDVRIVHFGTQHT